MGRLVDIALTVSVRCYAAGAVAYLAYSGTSWWPAFAAVVALLLVLDARHIFLTRRGR